MSSDQKQSQSKVVQEKLIVAYKSELYDLTEFIYKHPGGVNTLFNKNQKDIEKSFHDAEHSKAAEYLLHEYKIKAKNNLDERLEVNKIHEKSIQIKLMQNCFQHLVDWNDGMISQITRLGLRYEEWVNLPVDRRLKLFNNPILENMSKV